MKEEIYYTPIGPINPELDPRRQMALMDGDVRKLLEELCSVSVNIMQGGVDITREIQNRARQLQGLLPLHTIEEDGKKDDIA